MLTNEELNETVAIYKQHEENQSAAAEALGIARSTLQHRLEEATRRGLQGLLGSPLPVGMGVDRVTTQWSAASGTITQQWVKSKFGSTIQDAIPHIQDAFRDFRGLALTLPDDPPSGTDADKLDVFPIADLHLGMYAWKKEAGADYDVAIADKLLTQTVMDLLSRPTTSHTAMILNLGDFYHADNNQARTERSGNSLDVDTRFARVQRAGVDLMLQVIHLALNRYEYVIVRNIPGNHDPYSSVLLTIALQAYFHDHPRVTVEDSPSPFFFHQWGKTMIGAAHGDMAKPERIVSMMSAKEPLMWGTSLFRYVYMGHIHRRSSGALNSGEYGGAEWETFQTIAPRDAWGNSMGFTAGRSLKRITLHKDRGELDRETSPIIGAR